MRFSVLPSAAVGDYDLLRRGLSTTAGGDYKLEILGAGGRAFCLFRGSGGPVSLSAGPNLADNRWHSLGCARIGKSVVLTIDGVAFTKAGTTGTIANTSAGSSAPRTAPGTTSTAGSSDSVSISVG